MIWQYCSCNHPKELKTHSQNLDMNAYSTFISKSLSAQKKTIQASRLWREMITLLNWEIPNFKISLGIKHIF